MWRRMSLSHLPPHPFQGTLIQFGIPLIMSTETRQRPYVPPKTVNSEYPVSIYASVSIEYLANRIVGGVVAYRQRPV